MKKLFLMVIMLIALFTVIRVHSEESVKKDKAVSPSRFVLHPGCIELRGKDSDINISFGFVNVLNNGEKKWGFFPLSVSVVSKKHQIGIGFSGFQFFTKSGITIGKKIVVSKTSNRDIISLGGDIEISGIVNGDVWSFGADIILKKGARVKGDVVALGGNIKQSKGSKIYGNKESIPQLKIPVLGFITSGNSVVKIRAIVEIGKILLFLLVLFLIVFFFPNFIRDSSHLVFSSWKENVLYFLLLLLIIPLLFGLLIVSVTGVMFLSILVVVLMFLFYFGFYAVVVRVGMLFFKDEENVKSSKLYLFGLVGFFLFEIPFLLGLLLSTISGKVWEISALVLKGVSVSLWFVSALYGMGVLLGYLRRKNVG